MLVSILPYKVIFKILIKSNSLGSKATDTLHLPSTILVQYLLSVALHHEAWLCWRKEHSAARMQREMGSRTARQKDTCGAYVHPAHVLLPET